MVRLPKVSIDTDLSDGLCFGCGRNNPAGLKLDFKWDGRTARAEFVPGKHHQGWKGIVHGGIITCVLDEAMTYAVHFQGTICLTARMSVSFKRPALVNERLIITSSTTKNTKRLIETRASVSGQDGTLVAQATATQFVVGTRMGYSAEGTRGNARN